MSAEPIDTVLPFAVAPEGAPAAIDLTEPFHLGDWRIDPPLRRASKGETVVKIDPRNLRVLQILVERRGQLVSQREIETIAWEGVIVTPDSLYQSIRQLRQALGDTKSPAKYIETVPRRGYRLVALVSPVEGEDGDDQSSEKSQASAVLRLESTPTPPSMHPIERERVGRMDPLRRTSFRFALIMMGACFLITTLGSVRYLSRDTDQGLHGIAPDVISVERRISDGHLSGQETAEDFDAQAPQYLGVLALRKGHPQEAVSQLERALQIQLSRTGEDSEVVAPLLAELANAYFWLGDETAAHSTAMRAMSVLDRLAPASSPERIQTGRVLADVLTGAGDYVQAERLMASSLARALDYYGEAHVVTVDQYYQQAILRHAQGNLAEAERLARRTLEYRVRARGTYDQDVANTCVLLALILIDRGQLPEAQAQAQLAIDILKRVAGEQHPYLVSAKHAMAEVLLKQGRYTESETLLREELLVLDTEDASNWRIGRAASALGEALQKTGRLDEASRSLALARSKLTRTKGWPIERENRNLEVRLQELATLRSKQGSFVKL